MLDQIHTFDGTEYTIQESPAHGLIVKVKESALSLELVTRDGEDLYVNAITNTEAMKRAGCDSWSCDRISYVFSLAARRIVTGADLPWHINA